MKLALRMASMIALVALSASAGAQSRALWLDIGAASSRYADTLNATALSLSPTLRLVGTRASLTGSGTLSALSGAMSNSGTLDASLFSPTRSGFSAEVEGTTGGSAHSDGSKTGQFLGAGRIHVDADARGAWFGAGLGRTWDGAWRNIIQGDVGGWYSGPIGSVSLSIAPTSVDDSITYTDASLSLHHAFTSLDLDLSLGVRSGSQIPTLAANSKSWGSLGVTWRWRPDVGLVVGAGTYPVDLTQGFPGGRFLSVSVRLTPARAQYVTPAVATPSVIEATTEVEALALNRMGNGSQILRVRAPSARTVEVAGDFSTWNPVQLQRNADGSWAAAVRIPSGTHQIAIRVNGGKWTAPPGLVPVTDEFGGSVGVLLVP